VLAYAPAEGRTGLLPSAGLLMKPIQVAIPLPPRKGVPPSQTVDDPGRALAMREALAASGDVERARQCLAEAIYFEARSESEEGQVAVAQVILNRTRSKIYPSNVCDVVYQNADWYNRCQFSFACDRAARRRPNPVDRVRDPEAWAKAVAIADQVGSGERWLPWVGNATHYHADYVRPRWRRNMVQLSRVGRHVFYRLRSITRDLLKLPPKHGKDADEAAEDETGTEL
jgi:spore germination cell wall hydrolase CwlJ-like protein